MTVTDAQIVEKAREYLDTPWHHQARAKGVGVDCIGLIVGVANELGIPCVDQRAYSRNPNPRMLLRGIEASGAFDPIGIDEARFGDVLLFWVRKPNMPTHVGIVSDFRGLGFIHTNQSVNKVREAQLAEWGDRIHSAYRYRRGA